MPSATIDLRDVEGGCNIPLKVIPRSSVNQLSGIENGEIKLKIQAPPVEGTANAAVIEFISILLGRPKSALKVMKGLRSRHKVIRVQGLKAFQVLAVIENRMKKDEKWLNYSIKSKNL